VALHLAPEPDPRSAFADNIPATGSGQLFPELAVEGCVHTPIVPRWRFLPLPLYALEGSKDRQVASAFIRSEGRS
jgi:hypothetical protein